MLVYTGIPAPEHYTTLRSSLQWDPDEERLLLTAVRQQDLAAVQRQLAAGANPSAADVGGLSALHDAVVTADSPVVAALLAAGADVSATSSWWCGDATPLQHLIMQTCRLCAGPCMVHATLGPAAPLHHCSPWCEQVAGVVQQLAAAGALVDEGQLKQYHCPPLHHAAQAGCTTLVAALLQAGADPGNTTPTGYTVLHAAAVSGRREVVQQLVEALGPSRAAEVVNKLGRLQCGEQRVTPLHVAAHLGHLDVAMALVAAGADELIDGSCVEPLVVALAAGQSHLVPLLVTPTIVNEQYNGWSIRGGDRIECITPLHMAAVCPVPEVQEARPEEVPQMVAAAVRAVKALLAAGADTSVRNSLGHTPLAEAVECGHCEVVQVLLRHEVEQYKQQLEKQQHQHQHQQHPQQQQQQQQQQEQQKQKPSAASVLQEVGVKALIAGDGRTWQVLMSQAAEVLGEQGVHSLWHAFKQQLQQEVQQQQQQQHGQQQKLLGCAPYQQAVKALDAWVSCWAAAAGQLATQRQQFTGRLEQLVVHSCQQQQQQQAGACVGPGRPSKRPRLARELRLLGVSPAAAAAAGTAATGVLNTWFEHSSTSSGSRITRARATDMVARAAAVQPGTSASTWGAYRSSTAPADALRDLEAAAASGSEQEVQAVLQQMPDRAAGLAAAAVTVAAVGRKRNWGLCMQLLRELVMLDEAKGRAAVQQVQLHAYTAGRWRKQGHKIDGLVVPPKQSQDAPEPAADVATELAAALQVCDALLADWLAVRQQRVRELREAVVAAAGVAAAAPAACL